MGGALLTLLAFGIGRDAWGLVTLAAFAVTWLAGLAVKFGLHRFVAAYVLNVWFIIALGLPALYHLDKIPVSPWKQTVAWLAGSALWIACIAIVWLARGRRPPPPFVPEIPGDISPVKLTRPKILFTLIRALAVTIAVAISFGLHLPYAYWMPIATIVAMKPSLDQSELVAIQRLAGAALGAAIAALFLLTVSNKHALEVVVVLLAGVAGSIRMVNYAFYSAAVGAADLPLMRRSSRPGHPNLCSVNGCHQASMSVARRCCCCHRCCQSAGRAWRRVTRGIAPPRWGCAVVVRTRWQLAAGLFGR